MAISLKMIFVFIAASYTPICLVTLRGVWPLSKSLAWPGLLWMLIGGFFYTLGAGIYATRKPDPWPRTSGFHEIFHVLVMLGSMSHFWMTYRYI